MKKTLIAEEQFLCPIGTRAKKNSPHTLKLHQHECPPHAVALHQRVHPPHAAALDQYSCSAFWASLTAHSSVHHLIRQFIS